MECFMTWDELFGDICGRHLDALDSLGSDPRILSKLREGLGLHKDGLLLVSSDRAQGALGPLWNRRARYTRYHGDPLPRNPSDRVRLDPLFSSLYDSPKDDQMDLDSDSRSDSGAVGETSEALWGSFEKSVVFYAPSGAGKTYHVLRFGCFSGQFLTLIVCNAGQFSESGAVESKGYEEDPSFSVVRERMGPASDTPSVKNLFLRFLCARLLFLYLLRRALPTLTPEQYLLSQLSVNNQSILTPFVAAVMGRLPKNAEVLSEWKRKLESSLCQIFPQDSLSCAVDEISVLYSTFRARYQKNGANRDPSDTHTPYVAYPFLSAVCDVFPWRHFLLSGTSMAHDWWCNARSPLLRRGNVSFVSLKRQYRTATSFAAVRSYFEEWLSVREEEWAEVEDVWKMMGCSRMRVYAHTVSLLFDGKASSLVAAFRQSCEEVRKGMTSRIVARVGRGHRGELDQERQHRQSLQGLIVLLCKCCQHASLPRRVVLKNSFDLLPSSLAFPAEGDFSERESKLVWEFDDPCVDLVLRSLDWRDHFPDLRRDSVSEDELPLQLLVSALTGEMQDAGFLVEKVLASCIAKHRGGVRGREPSTFVTCLGEMDHGYVWTQNDDQLRLFTVDEEDGDGDDGIRMSRDEWKSSLPDTPWKCLSEAHAKVENLENIFHFGDVSRFLSPKLHAHPDFWYVNQDQSILLFGASRLTGRDKKIRSHRHNLKTTSSALTFLKLGDCQASNDATVSFASKEDRGLRRSFVDSFQTRLQNVRCLIRIHFELSEEAVHHRYRRSSLFLLKDTGSLFTSLSIPNGFKEILVWVDRNTVGHLVGEDNVFWTHCAWLFREKGELRIVPGELAGIPRSLAGVNDSGTDSWRLLAQVAGFRDESIQVRHGAVDVPQRVIKSFRAIRVCVWSQSPAVDLSGLSLDLPESDDELSDTFNRALLGVDETAIAEDQLVDFYVLFRELRMVDYCYVLCRKAASFEGDDLAKLRSRASPFELNLSRDLAIVTALSPGPKNLENHPEFAALARPLPTTFAAAARRLYVKARTDGVGMNVVLTTNDEGEEKAHIEVLVSRSVMFHRMFEFGGAGVQSMRDEGKIAVENLSHVLLCDWLEFIYTGEIREVGFQALVRLLVFAGAYEEVELSKFVFSRVPDVVKGLGHGEICLAILESGKWLGELSDEDRKRLFLGFPGVPGLDFGWLLDRILKFCQQFADRREGVMDEEESRK